MREKLALTGDGLSESMREASLGRRELEQASLTIMQVHPHSCACLPVALVPCPETGRVRARVHTSRCAFSAGSLLLVAKRNSLGFFCKCMLLVRVHRWTPRFAFCRQLAQLRRRNSTYVLRESAS